MADSQEGIEQQVENIIIAGFAHSEGDVQGTNTQDGTGGCRVIDVDLYRLEGGAVLLVPNNGDTPLDATAIESVAPTSQDEASSLTETPPIPLVGAKQETITPQEQETEPTIAKSTKRWVKPSFVLIPLVLLYILVAGAVSYLYLLPLTATATVTITPKAKSLHTDTTFTIAANPKGGQVQGRPLQASSFTKSVTVAATGHAHDDATNAAGVITFYNADSQSYTIPAGVTLTTPDGATIVTDNAVTVQAAVLPEVGIAITAAHVIQAGSIGNIPAHAIYARCCGSAFLTATNTTPFTGGHDAEDYRFIQSSDIQNAASNLLTHLTPQATAQLQKQVHAGESSVTPLCSPHTQESAQAGAAASDVTVSVTQTCRSVAYTLASLQQVATSTLARRLNLANYEQVDTTQVTVNGSTYTNQRATLNVSVSGMWVYRFTKTQFTNLTRRIAGESQQQAKATLVHIDGVAQVSIRLQRFDFNDHLPTDPEHIAIQLLYLVS